MPGCQPDAPCHHTWPWLALSRCPLFLLSLLASTATAARTVGNGVQDACSKFPKIRVDDCRSCRRAKRRRRAGWPTILEYRGVHVAVLARIAAQVFDVLLSRTVRKVLNVLQARIHSTPSQDIIPHANSNSKDITSSTEKRTSDFQKDISDTISSSSNNATPAEKDSKRLKPLNKDEESTDARQRTNEDAHAAITN